VSQYHVPEDLNSQLHRCESLRSHNLYLLIESVWFSQSDMIRTWVGLDYRVLS